MKTKIFNNKFLIALSFAIGTSSCVPDTIDGDGNGLTPTNSDASFTVTKTSENHYRLTSSNNNYISSKWDIGIGTFSPGPNVYDIFLPDEGTYDIGHQIIGQGGIVGGTATQKITVEKSDPKAGNLIKGGKFMDATDVAKWSLTFANPNGTDGFALWTWGAGSATFTATKWNRNVMYQAVEVVEGRKYQADAIVSSKSGVSDSWFEIYVGYNLAYPNKNLYFTEQWTGSNSSFAGDLIWHMKNVIIGSMRNWSKVALEWNLANDASFNPHTTGGCTECKGAITITSGEAFTKNVAYYIIGQASKFVPQNSQRIASSQPGSLSTVAFTRPDGKIALIVLNEGDNTENFNIKYNSKTAATALPGKSVATFVF